MQRINWQMQKSPQIAAALFQLVQDGLHLERNTQQLYCNSTMFQGPVSARCGVT